MIKMTKTYNRIIKQEAFYSLHLVGQLILYLFHSTPLPLHFPHTFPHTFPSLPPPLPLAFLYV
jgi:hypothetical protein